MKRQFSISCLVWLWFAVAVGSVVAAPVSVAVVPRPRAHAHNDYHHDRPLLDALDHGFCSVEADIFLIDGKLLVGHSRAELRPERTLESLYLQPLQERVRSNEGRVYRRGPAFTLLIDIKSGGEETYTALHQVLGEFSNILTRVKNGHVKSGPVTVIISGNRAKNRIAATSPRYSAIDGRLSDLETTMPSHMMPLISDRWTSHFRWLGQSDMPPHEKKKLRRIVRQAHTAGRRVRFWATPEDERVWDELIDAGVDFINTDDLAGLEKFLAGKSASGS